MESSGVFIREEIELSLRASYGQEELQEDVKEAAKKALEQGELALLKTCKWSCYCYANTYSKSYIWCFMC